MSVRDGGRRSRRPVLVVTAMLAAAAVTLVASACGEDADEPSATGTATAPGSQPPASEAPSPAGDHYALVTTVMEDGDGVARMCFWILDSAPPQCDDPVVREVVGLDWAAVPTAQSSQGTTWADLRLVGTWDASTRRFTVSETPVEADRSGMDPMSELEVPCPEPEGGWDEGPVDYREQDAAAWLQERTDISATWLGPMEGSSGVQVLVVRVADGGAVTDVEQGVRQRYTGPLCVVSGGRQEGELTAVMTEIEEAVGDEHVSNSLDVVAGHVEVTVMLATPELQAELDERFGEGTVVLKSALQPAD